MKDEDLKKIFSRNSFEPEIEDYNNNDTSKSDNVISLSTTIDNDSETVEYPINDDDVIEEEFIADEQVQSDDTEIEDQITNNFES